MLLKEMTPIKPPPPASVIANQACEHPQREVGGSLNLFSRLSHGCRPPRGHAIAGSGLGKAVGLGRAGKGEQTSLKQPPARGDPAPYKTTTFCPGSVQPGVREPPCSEPGPGHASVILLRGGIRDGLLHR